MATRTVALVVLALLAAGCGGASGGSTSTAGGGSAGPGTTIDKPVPASLLNLPLRNQHGQRITLASYPGRTVLLVPFLSLCQDICPMITGNLLQVQQSLNADHAASKVQIIEVSVDPERDTPKRLAAYAKLTHATWVLATESPAALRTLAKYFGFTYAKVPEDKPASLDWLTGKPLTYDIDHSDNYFVIDPRRSERVVQDAAPAFHGNLNPKLRTFLSELGRRHLAQPPQPSWTPPDALKALAVSVGRSLPVSQLQ
jgi:cytochrome oxidase Cu insertion factor (SCO1/SenC/PrrC family)